MENIVSEGIEMRKDRIPFIPLVENTRFSQCAMNDSISLESDELRTWVWKVDVGGGRTLFSGEVQNRIHGWLELENAVNSLEELEMQIHRDQQTVRIQIHGEKFPFQFFGRHRPFGHRKTTTEHIFVRARSTRNEDRLVFSVWLKGKGEFDLGACFSLSVKWN